MSNLKGFPFKTPQKCCELSFIYFVDWDEEDKKMGGEQQMKKGDCEE